jgi:hypothetical protein
MNNNMNHKKFIEIYWPVLKITLAACAVFLLAVMAFNTGKKDNMDLYIAQYEIFKQKADSAVVHAESLKVVIDEEKEKAAIAQAKAVALDKQVVLLTNRTKNLVRRRDSLLAKIDSTTTIVDSLEFYINTTHVQDSIILAQDTIITTKNFQIELLNISLTHKDTAITLLTTSRDSLLTVVKNIPDVPKNPNRTIFGIKLPSRTTTFITGAVFGAVTTAVILR